MSKPEEATEEVLVYLNELRESGATNMFSAGSYLEDEFEFDRRVARKVLRYWMWMDEIKRHR